MLWCCIVPKRDGAAEAGISGIVIVIARSDVIHKLTKQPKDEVDDEDEKFEAAEAAPARHLDDFVRPPPPLRISLIWKGRGKRERE